MKKYILICFYITVSCVYSFLSLASDNVKKTDNHEVVKELSIEDEIKRKINTVDPNLNIGVKIVNLDRNEVVFSQNIDRYYIPASTLKFISILSLMDNLGLDYKFSSYLKKYEDHYYIDINDPDFSVNDLRNIVSFIAKDSNNKIEGNIYILDNKFSVNSVVRSRICSDGLYCYGAPVTKVHVNKNCSTLIATPGKEGQKIKISIEDNVIYPYVIENSARTLKQGRFDRINTKLVDNRSIITGTLSKDTGKVKIGTVANDNIDQVRYYLEKIIDDREKLEFLGAVLPAHDLPKSIKNVFSIDKKIKDIASSALKQSDNFISDYLLAQFATEHKEEYWTTAVNKLKGIIDHSFGVSFAKSNIKDASGLSRLNLISINQASDFLGAVSKKQYFDEVKSLLSNPGDQKSNRFKSMDKIYFKTGTLEGVSAVVGYFYNKKEELNSFVIMSNNFFGPSKSYKELEENIIWFLYNKE